MERCYRLAELLARGHALDRESVAAMLGIGLASAARHLKAIESSMTVIVDKQKGRKTIKVGTATPPKRLATPTVVAACLGASLARLFQDTPFAARLQEVAERMVAASSDPSSFTHRDRQFIFLSRGGERGLRRGSGLVLETVIDALLARRLLRIKHTRFSGEVETLRMKPYSLALHEHQLYVLGSVDGSLRIVRFARIRRALALSERFEYPSLDEYDPRLVFRHSLGVFIHDEPEKDIAVRPVRLVLSPRWRSYVMTHRWHESQEQEVTDQGVRLDLVVRTCPELRRLILGFGAEAEVIEPADLRQEIARAGRATAALYSKKRAREPARRTPAPSRRSGRKKIAPPSPAPRREGRRATSRGRRARR